jgi:magnesium chelatase accessory protein
MNATLLRDWELRDWPNREFSRFVHRGGIRWHVQVMGSGPVLLLVHGTGASTHSYRDLMPLLAEQFTVVAPDLPGHAFTIPPAHLEPSPAVFSSALQELLEALELTPVVTVGHSAGAAVVARMALDCTVKPKLVVGLAAALVPLRGLARAVLVPTARLLARSSIASNVISLGAHDRNGVDRMIRTTGSNLDARGIELYRRLSTRPDHVGGALAMMASWDLDSLYADLPEVTSRVLLLAGARDRAVPLAQQELAAARMPDARVVVVDDVGHLLHEEAPARVAGLIADELKAIES